MKLLRSNTIGYWRTALAVAAFLAASQTAGASAIYVLFTVSPIDTLMAPGASGTFEVDLKNIGPESLTIGAFRFGLTTSASGITFDSVTTGTLSPYIFTYPSQNRLALASVLNPSVAVMDLTGSQSRTLLPGDIAGLGYITYHVNSNAVPGSVINISFAPPAEAGWSCTGPPSGLCEYLNIGPVLDWPTGSDTFDPADLKGGTLTVGNSPPPVDPPVDVPEPSSLLPVGLILIGLGVLGKQRIRTKKRRRSVPGMRRSEPLRPNRTEPCEHYHAV